MASTSVLLMNVCTPGKCAVRLRRAVEGRQRGSAQVADHAMSGGTGHQLLNAACAKHIPGDIRYASTVQACRVRKRTANDMQDRTAIRRGVAHHVLNPAGFYTKCQCGPSELQSDR